MVRPIIGANLKWMGPEKSMERKWENQRRGPFLGQKKGTAAGRAFHIASGLQLFFLLFVVLVLDRLHAALVLRLRFGFFHGFLGFGDFLGAGFGALFFLFVEDLLAAEEFEESLVGSVAFVPVSADDARVAAVAIAETRADRVEQLDQGFIGHEVSASQAASGEVAAFAQRDHLFDDGARRFGLGNGSFDPLLDDHGCDQVAEQRTPVRRVPSEFVSCYFVTHMNLRSDARGQGPGASLVLQGPGVRDQWPLLRNAVGREKFVYFLN